MEFKRRGRTALSSQEEAGGSNLDRALRQMLRRVKENCKISSSTSSARHRPTSSFSDNCEGAFLSNGNEFLRSIDESALWASPLADWPGGHLFMRSLTLSAFRIGCTNKCRSTAFPRAQPPNVSPASHPAIAGSGPKLGKWCCRDGAQRLNATTSLHISADSHRGGRRGGNTGEISPGLGASPT